VAYTGQKLLNTVCPGTAITGMQPYTASGRRMLQAWAASIAADPDPHKAMHVVKNFTRQLHMHWQAETAQACLHNFQPPVMPDAEPLFLRRLTLAGSMQSTKPDEPGPLVCITTPEATTPAEVQHSLGRVEKIYDDSEQYGRSLPGLPAWLQIGGVNQSNPVVRVIFRKEDGHTLQAGITMLVELRHLSLPGTVSQHAWELSHPSDEEDPDGDSPTVNPEEADGAEEDDEHEDIGLFRPA
jgi:hypothetical protein